MALAPEQPLKGSAGTIKMRLDKIQGKILYRRTDGLGYLKGLFILYVLFSGFGSDLHSLIFNTEIF